MMHEDQDEHRRGSTERRLPVCKYIWTYLNLTSGLMPIYQWKFLHRKYILKKKIFRHETKQKTKKVNWVFLPWFWLLQSLAFKMTPFNKLRPRTEVAILAMFAWTWTLNVQEILQDWCYMSLGLSATEFMLGESILSTVWLMVGVHYSINILR